jgi:hypothetical protein
MLPHKETRFHNVRLGQKKKTGLMLTEYLVPVRSCMVCEEEHTVFVPGFCLFFEKFQIVIFLNFGLRRLSKLKNYSLEVNLEK